MYKVFAQRNVKHIINIMFLGDVGTFFRKKNNCIYKVLKINVPKTIIFIRFKKFSSNLAVLRSCGGCTSPEDATSLPPLAIRWCRTMNLKHGNDISKL